tara:strand:- start:434 stop:610 length:177 start_codon:yes stop_codon:yes gene_type:complete
MKVGDLVRMRNMRVWNGELGIILTIPTTPNGMWSIVLSSGELVGTGRVENIEVINESR